MSEQEPTRVAKQAYSAFLRGDIPGVLNLVTDDVNWFVSGPSIVRHAGQRNGRNEVTQFFTTLGESMEALVFEPQHFITQGDKVAVQGHYRWKVLDTGKEFESDWCHVFTVRGGRISGFKEYFDTAAGVEGYSQT